MKCENCIHFEVCSYVSYLLPSCDSYAELQVLCKDCMHFKMGKYCTLDCSDAIREPTDFCSYGKRRADELSINPVTENVTAAFGNITAGAQNGGLAMNELKPCKKCGYHPGRRLNYGHFSSNRLTYRISCPSCGYCTKEKETLEEAIEAWNREAAHGQT